LKTEDEVDRLRHEQWLRTRDERQCNIAKARDALTIMRFMGQWGSTRMMWTIEQAERALAAMRGEDVFGEVLHQSVRATCAVRWGSGARLLDADVLLALMEHANEH